MKCSSVQHKSNAHAIHPTIFRISVLVLLGYEELDNKRWSKFVLFLGPLRTVGIVVFESTGMQLRKTFTPRLRCIVSLTPCYAVVHAESDG